MLFKKYFLLALVQLLCSAVLFAQSSSSDVINLEGIWHFKLDSTDVGEQEQWFNKKLGGEITLFPVRNLKNGGWRIECLHLIA